MPDKRLNPRQDGQDSLGMPSKRWGGLYTKEINGTDAVQLSAYMNNMLLQRQKAYVLGAAAFCSDLPSELILECTTAGTTGAEAPSFTGVTEGSTVTDGSVVWTCRSILNGGGGGGGALNVLEITQAQYDALTPAQKADKSKLYVITDVDPSSAGGGGNFNITELTQQEYDDLSQEEKTDPSKIYLITDANPSDANQFNGVPLGVIVPYVAETQNPPAGFLFCDGSAVSRLIYSDLFGAIGTTYGAGDGSTTFNLPDLTGGEFLEGSDTAGTAKEAGLPNITGETGKLRSSALGGIANSGALRTYQTSETTSNVSTTGTAGLFDINFDASQSNAIYGNSDTVQPKSLTVRYLIKYLPNVIDSEISAADAASQAKAAAQAAEAYAGSAGIPIGTLFPFAANTQDPPTGYLFCDGSAVSRTMYADLFSVLGTTWGAGDGSTTFNLPTSEDLVMQGASALNPVGTYKSAGLPNITGSTAELIGNSSARLRVRTDATGAFSTTKMTYNTMVNSTSNTGDYYHVNDDFDASRSSAIYGNSDTVQPPAACVTFIIKAYDGVTPGSAGIDLSQYASDLSNKASRGLDNLTDAGKDRFLGDDNFCIIYPNGGTAQNPANITTNSRYVMDNPFPGYRVHCVLEVLYSNTWGETGSVYSGGGRGAKAGQLNDGSIVVQTGNSCVYYALSNNTLDPFGASENNTISSLPARVKVWKIGKIQS